ncbi:gastrula zinc finger protein XlCGF52.1-like isoform X2 [Dreissena polymorpha]|nr:gastrula zinc finger protein XlCGF52.1-like isoform X2 [Dreissena polymorpha]XP_052266180.1 gastrula zinc finger protein XlCGF52.1-like isoform X2 [Dreissena polymorpha]
MESLDTEVIVLLLKKGSQIVENYGTPVGKRFLQEKSEIVQQFVCYCQRPPETVDSQSEHGGVKNEVTSGNADDHVKGNVCRNHEESVPVVQATLHHKVEENNLLSTTDNCIIETVNQTTKFTCLICCQDFSCKTSYAGHVRTCDLNKSFRCRECDCTFQTENQYVNHKQEHGAGQLFHCNKCDKVYKSKKSLNNHSRSMHTNNRYQCKICGKFFNYSHGLARHEKSHSDIRDYKCSFCDKAFKNKKDRVNHENNMHTKENQYICHLCGKTTASPTVYRNHMRKHEGKPIKLARSCRYCGESMTNYTALVRHIMKLHEQEDLDHKVPLLRRCPVCSKVFPQRSIKIHEDSHVGIKRFTCNCCQRRFSCAPNLQAHLRTVHRDTPMFCAMCSVHFTNRMAWNNHLASHVDSVC